MNWIFLSLVLLVSCSGSGGPSEKEVISLAGPHFFMPETSFQVEDFKIVSDGKLKQALDGSDGHQYVVKMGIVAKADCQYHETSMYELTRDTSGFSMNHGASPFSQKIHECLSKNDIDEKVKKYEEGWRLKLGKADYSKCRKNDFSCGGEPVTEELIKEKSANFRESLLLEISSWKTVKAGEKIQIADHYVNLKKPHKSEKWMVSGIGLNN